jgi:hypothetical protein
MLRGGLLGGLVGCKVVVGRWWVLMICSRQHDVNSSDRLS